ncbi:MAG: winged helix-turn-helix domain-containing protein [Candidatus Micrarchaeota archaeon]
MTLKKLLYWLVAGSRGGPNRARLLMLLSDRPANAKQISDSLKLDYKTVQHHVELLLKHGLLDAIGEGYGKAYTLSPEMEGMMDEIRKLVKNRKG